MLKSGIDYFPLDVRLDDKWKLVEAEFGLQGFAIVVKLLQKIYGERGYYCELQDDVALLFAHECGVGGNVVSEIVNACIKRGIFDETMYKKYNVLTSEGIQKRYFEAVKRRNDVKVVPEYLYPSFYHFAKDVCKNAENVCKKEENACNSEQIRKDKIRVNKSKVNNNINAIFDKLLDDFCAENLYGEEVRLLLGDWLQIRKAKRAPSTEKAIQLNLNKLNRCAEQSNLSVQSYLEEVITRGWQAFYPIPDYSKSGAESKKGVTFYELGKERGIFKDEF